jgi:hypothetical protein
MFTETQILSQNVTGSDKLNSTDPVTTNLTQSFMTGNVTAAQAAKYAAKAKASIAKGNNTKVADDTEGSALFEYLDEETGLSQRFAFNLRYYLGASSIKVNKEKAKIAKEKNLA